VGFSDDLADADLTDTAGSSAGRESMFLMPGFA
jgi:hypothetical protein